MLKIALSLSLSLLTAPSVAAYTPLQPEKKHASIERSVVKQLQDKHYNRVKLDDDFSAQLLNAFLDALDGNHSIFLASDIERFQNKYRHKLDDQLKKGDVSADFDIYNTYLKRRIEIDEWLLTQIKAGIDALDLTNAEALRIEREDAPWPADAQARHALWTQLLENQVIEMRLSDMDDAEIQKRLTQRYENELEWLRQTVARDAFAAYMSAYAKNYDPHTDYLSPRDSEEFDIRLNLSLRGIGAQLRTENGYAEIVRLIPGGPAAQSGLLQPTDRIVAVAQGKDGDFTDVVGMRLQDTVRLIRGEIGTTVRLQIRPGDGGEIETVPLVRDKIELKAQKANKRIIEVKRDGATRKIGLIRLPTFYNGTAEDVAKLLEELKQEDVAGVIVDLRNNGGGALGEVVKLTGLFMGPAPAVQIRNADGNAQATGDPDAQAVFSGPMAVMVNRLSASASEIFAGAIQDYGRGIIVGNQTFGKGTVQAVLPLSRDGKKGRLTLTRAKFYRISGDSTQRHGVIPDIAFPSFVNPEEIGEDTLPHALPWDQIDPIDYPQSDFIRGSVPQLLARHNDRIEKDPDYQYLVKRIELARERSEREQLSLVLDERQAQQKQLQQQRLTLVNTYRDKIGKPPFKDFKAFQESEDRETPAEELTPRADSEEQETDAYQKEAAQILLDITRLFSEQTRTRQAASGN